VQRHTSKEVGLKFGTDKGELRMRRSNYGALQWSLAAPPPGTVARSRRWNLVLIAILAFLVLGVFVVAEAPHTGSSASNSANALRKEGATPPSVQHANSVKGLPRDIHGREGSGYLHKDLRGGHHTS
jgi:hypothetical protein